MLRWKNIMMGAGLILLLLGVYHHRLLRYAAGQAAGQLRILWQARPLEEVLADPAFPDTLKENLRLVPRIRQFAFDSLGLTPSGNYTTVYDQQGREVLWVVTACHPYAFEPLTWSFPVVGTFTYKGFFDYGQARRLARKLRRQGYDVELRAVSGWSTLGWFNDPVLSNMLAGSKGELAATLIHELTHGTVFVPDSMTFNENLATFIGRQGALDFLEHEYGRESLPYRQYREQLHDSRLLTGHLVRGAACLDSLYGELGNRLPGEKAQLKQALISQIAATIDTLSFHNPARYLAYLTEERLNNAFFISFLNYRERQEEFHLFLQDSCAGNLRCFVSYWRARYPCQAD